MRKVCEESCLERSVAGSVTGSVTGSGHSMAVYLAHQKVSGMERNVVSSSSFSAKYARLEKIMIPMARNNIRSPNSL